MNSETLPFAPTTAMQFGLCLQRILQRLAYCNPAFGPPLLAEIDLADGYYRIPITPSASLTLAVVLPSDGSPEPLIGLPLSLPMGWKNSPPYFCAFTETCTDLANSAQRYQHPDPFPHAHIAQPALQKSPLPAFHNRAILPYNIQPYPADTPAMPHGRIH